MSCFVFLDPCELFAVCCVRCVVSCVLRGVYIFGVCTLVCVGSGVLFVLCCWVLYIDCCVLFVICRVLLVVLRLLCVVVCVARCVLLVASCLLVVASHALFAFCCVVCFVCAFRMHYVFCVWD